jgi:anti-sigma factor RsiW
MIRCEDVLRELSNYIDREVTPDLRRQIEEHLGACHHCTVLVSTTRKTLSLVADSSILELPSGVSQRLLTRLAVHWS